MATGESTVSRIGERCRYVIAGIIHDAKAKEIASMAFHVVECNARTRILRSTEVARRHVIPR